MFAEALAGEPPNQLAIIRSPQPVCYDSGPTVWLPDLKPLFWRTNLGCTWLCRFAANRQDDRVFVLANSHFDKLAMEFSLSALMKPICL